MSPEPILYVFSGAGLSAESGVATFRSPGGTWTRHNIDRLCNAFTWKEHRGEVFEFYRARRLEVAQAQPCEAHFVLARLQATFGPARVRLLTQNVDDLLERAGAPEVAHLHGDLVRLHCTACDTKWPVSDADYAETTRCPKCGSLKGVKPGVTFFHQAAPEYRHLNKMLRGVRRQDLCLVVGTSLQVVSADRLIPQLRYGSDRNYQVNPELVQPEYFGNNLAVSACLGLSLLEAPLGELMSPVRA